MGEASEDLAEADGEDLETLGGDREQQGMNTLVSVVIPTRNEEDSIALLLSHFNFASNELRYEAIIVDDSSDKTAEVAAVHGAKVIRGQGKGLGQAIIDGIENSKGDIVVVMSANGEHPPCAIPNLLKPILEEGADVVIGSRYVKGRSNPEWKWNKRIASRVACLLALPVTSVKDATSEFFAFRKSILEGGK